MACLLIGNYEPELARENQLLRQERFDDYMVINAIGGKSWKIGDKYISLFVSLNNIFDQKFKSGGFEQERFDSYMVINAIGGRSAIFTNPYKKILKIQNVFLDLNIGMEEVQLTF